MGKLYFAFMAFGLIKYIKIIFLPNFPTKFIDFMMSIFVFFIVVNKIPTFESMCVCNTENRFHFPDPVFPHIFSYLYNSKQSGTHKIYFYYILRTMYIHFGTLIYGT